MEKQKKIYLILLLISASLCVADIVLFVVNIFKLWLFLTLLGIFILSVIVFVILLIKNAKRKKVVVEEEKVQSVGDYNIDLYRVLGIPLKYNEDGTVKNIYELLGIEPVYDEKGNRVETVYELLKMMPKFNSEGQEIPLVFSIKNRVGKIAKVDVSSRVLTRKLTEEEKEALVIKEALKQKLKEAEEKGDTKLQQAIKKVVDKTVKKPQSNESGEDKPKYKIKGGGKAVERVSLNYKAVKINSTNVLESLFDVIKASRSLNNKVEEKKKEPPKKVEEKKTEEPKKQPEKPTKDNGPLVSFKVKLSEDEADDKLQPEA